MVATSDTFDGGRPRSRRIYVNGKIHPDLRVPMREIEQSPTRTLAGVDEQNEPLSVSVSYTHLTLPTICSV